MLNIPPTSYLLPLTSCAMRRAKRCAAPCRAKRCSAPSDASCPAERSIVNYELSIVHCPLSIISCFLTLQSYNTGRAKSRIFPKRCRAARVFLLRRRCSVFIVNRLVANGQNGQRADGLWLMRGGASGTAGWASGQSGHLVIWSKSILDRQKTPL